MIVNPSVFDPSITSEQVYQIINDLPIGYNGLSQQMHYWGRLFGVVTGDQNEQDWDNFVVNQCIRDSIWSTLRAITEETESFTGFNLSRRFHNIKVNDIDFGRNLRVMPGIESVNHIPVFTGIPDLNEVPISPFILEDLEATSEGQRWYVLLPDTVVDNPHDVILRRSTDFGVYEPDRTRRPVKVGNDWKVYLDNQPTPYVALDKIVVQSTKYVYVDIDNPVLDDGELVATFPATNQIIPMAKLPQTLAGNKTRYWYYIWTLVDPSFYNNPVNLIYAEYYKLLPFISYKQYTEEEVFGLLVIDCDCACADCGNGERRYQVSAEIVDSRRGIVAFNIDGELLDQDDDGIYEYLDAACDDCIARALCGGTCSYELSFPYITNPIHLDETLRMSIPQILRALTFRVAAELPMVDCGCWKDDKERIGFIARQQETFGGTTTNPFTGTTALTIQYGDLRGQKAYVQMMSKVPRVKYTYL